MSNSRRRQFYPNYGKRIVDLSATLVAVLVLFPLMVLVGLVIWLTMGRPVLFRQLRPGLQGKPFVLYKFRTMREIYDEHGKPLPDENRLTSVGHLLRVASLDELPEAINVFKGDMSLVGPRPLHMEYLPLYTPQQARRHEVRPGITGWALIHGRNVLTWEEKFGHDVWYVDHVSFWLDLKILALTVWKVLKREGISHTGHATMPEFRPKDPDRNPVGKKGDA